MRLLQELAKISATFDDPHFVLRAGLAPVMALATEFRNPTAPESAAPGLVTSCRSQRRSSSGRDDYACVTAGQTAIVRWILPLRMPLTGPHAHRF